MNLIETIVLDNGLTIYLYKDNRKHSTFFQINTFCGGYTKDFIYKGCEYHIQDGVAHMLEHYLVECNDRGNFLDLLGEKQMSTNASTSVIYTDYYFETVENVAYGIHTVLDGMYHVSFTDEKLDKLKGPIIQEVRGKQDMRSYHASHKRFEDLFHNVTFRDIGGSLEEIEKTKAEDLELLYKAFYHPKNQFIAVAGNFDKEEVINTIKEFYDTLTFDEFDTKLIPLNEGKDVVKMRDHFKFEVPMDYTEVDFKVDLSKYSPKEQLDFDFYLGTYINHVTGITSHMYQDLIKRGIIHDPVHFVTQIVDNYLIVIVGGFTTNMDVLEEEIVKAVCSKNEFNEEKYEVDRDHSILQISLREESIFKMIVPFINNVVYYNYPHVDTIDDVHNMTFDKYKNVIKDVDFSNYIFLRVTKE